MDLFERLASLKVEKAMARIEIAGRVMEEAGDRLRRRVELWEDIANQMVNAAEAIEKYGRRRDEAASEAERQEHADVLADDLKQISHETDLYANEIVKEAEEDR